jgi:hypothetical protein
VKSQSRVRLGFLLASLRIVLIFDGDHPQLVLFWQGLEEGGVGVPESHTFWIPVALLDLTVDLEQYCQLVVHLLPKCSNLQDACSVGAV